LERKRGGRENKEVGAQKDSLALAFGFHRSDLSPFEGSPR